MPICKNRFDVHSDLKFIYVGRVSREKNLHYLAQAFKRFIQKGVGAHLIIAGDGPCQEDMKREMAGYPCVFTGYQEGEALSEIYASADVFVFPSTTGTFGNVVLEAQSSGLPVIATDQGGDLLAVILGHFNGPIHCGGL
jgi:glycosyltransferase involved in cell wall biosynthesis